MRIQVVARLSNPELLHELKQLCFREGWLLFAFDYDEFDEHTVLITDDRSEAEKSLKSPAIIVFHGHATGLDAERVIHLRSVDALADLPRRIETKLNLSRFKQQFFNRNDAEPITKLPRHPELLEVMRSRRGVPMGVIVAQIDHASHLYTNLDPVSKTDLLSALAEQLITSLPTHAELGILDASCFVIWIEDTNLEMLSHTAHALQSLTVEAIQFRSGQLHLTFSIGFDFDKNLTDPQVLWHSAWTAREAATRQGGNTVVAGQRDQSLETSIPAAIARDEFSLVLQPQYTTDGTTLKGVEALLRWQGMEVGSLAPDRFIPVAERSGQMARVGDWVIERASTESTAWLEYLTTPITLALNVPPQQFVKNSIRTQIERLTKDHWVNPAILELELTHENLLQVVDQHRATLFALREMGVRIAIDNLGTGLVDTEKLLRCPADTLKIDRTLVQRIAHDTTARELTEYICRLGERFSLRVVAVGVETEDQQAILEDMGCPEAQGFYYSEPIALERFQQFLNNDAAQSA